MRASTQRRLVEVLDAAETLFSQRGITRTRLCDVAERVGVSEPALYRYVETKGALFDAVIRRLADPHRNLSTVELPIAAPPEGATLAFMAGYFAGEGRIERLDAALRADPPVDADAARDELEVIITVIFRGSRDKRQWARMINACFMELPGLSEVWDTHIRGPWLDQLTRLIGDRQARGLLPTTTEPASLARGIVAQVVAAAVYPHLTVWSKAPAAEVEQTTLNMIMASFRPG